MSGTLLTTGTSTDLAALRIARRVHGDLLAMVEKLEVSSATSVADLVHDLGLAIAADAIELLSVFLYEKGANSDSARRVYEYRRVARSVLEESTHSGRIINDATLRGGRIEFELRTRDAAWASLKAKGNLKIAWSDCTARSKAGMSTTPDGGYGAGTIGLSRSCLIRI